ncbi:MAG: hypothetical protein GF315_11870 [candidate division Zixibacteria bacterium]|nr:hypothetical protein [candidate division Zixibacteria bacterium]
MLTSGIKPGFGEEKLKNIKDPKVGKDDRGYYIYTANENVKVYFGDFYEFLEKTEEKAQKEFTALRKKVAECPEENEETLAYLRAKKIIVEQLLLHISKAYSDSLNLSSVMSPWCFGTVVLEKIEIYKDKISKGQVHDPNIPEYPFFVLRYIDEIYKSVLLDLFEFPSKAFSMRWQYTELLKKYSKVLSNITTSLQNVVMMIKSGGGI